MRDPVSSRGSPAEVLTAVASAGLERRGGADLGERHPVYLKQPALRQRKLLWMTPQGRETAIAAPLGDYATGRVSPDGWRIAVVRRDGQGGVVGRRFSN